MIFIALSQGSVSLGEFRPQLLTAGQLKPRRTSRTASKACDLCLRPTQRLVPQLKLCTTQPDQDDELQLTTLGICPRSQTA